MNSALQIELPAGACIIRFDHQLTASQVQRLRAEWDAACARAAIAGHPPVLAAGPGVSVEMVPTARPASPAPHGWDTLENVR